MLRATLNKSWEQHTTKQQLYGHLPPISQIIQIRRRHAGHCWSKNELISDVLLGIPLHGRASIGRPTRTYQRHLCTDTGCSLEDLPEAIDDRDEWRERERERERKSQGNPCSQRELMMMMISVHTHTHTQIYMVYSISFQTFLYRHSKLS